MSTIFITEKPSVAREYQSVLGVKPKSKTDGYVEGHSDLLNDNVIITWAVGHLIAICQPKEQNEEWGVWDKSILPMIPSNFKYKPQESTLKQFNIVKSLYTRKDITAIYYAGDSGREGIYIQALIRNQIFKTAPKNIDEKVVWIDSFTDAEIKRGIKEAKSYSAYETMIKSGYARAITDWLIGMNFTTAFTITSRSKIITGRVVTPTLAMVVKRQKEIDSFVKTDYYGIKAEMDGSEALWEACEKSRFFESPDLYNENGFLKIENAEALKAEFDKDKTLTIINTEQKKNSETAPLFFNQTDLQAYCSKVFKISPSDTLAAAQRLYEGKYTTYPRTSARVISTAVANDLKSKGYNIPKKYINDKQIVDHYAIIPTFDSKANPAKLQGLDKSIYEAILKRFMDTMKPPYEYYSISITYQHSNKEFFFERFTNIIQKGWKDNIDEKDMVQRPIPEKGKVVNVNSFSLRNLETTPPSAYTTGSLVKEMEKAGKFIDDEELRAQIKSCGLGTDATRAGIIQKLVDTGYITVDKKQKIAATDFGKSVIGITEKYDEQLVSPVKTADLESNLSAIVDSEMEYDDFIKNVEEYVKATTMKIVNSNTERLSNGTNGNNESLGACPHCGGEIKKGKFGYYCTKKCGMLVSKIFGKELTDTQLKNLLNKKNIQFTTKNGKKITVEPEAVPYTYEGKEYFIWKTQNNTAVKDSGKTHNCPCCNNPLKVTPYGWKCDCGFSFGAEICGHKMTENDLEDLINNGETKSYQFISKAKKKFTAKMVVNAEQHKTEFKF